MRPPLQIMCIDDDNDTRAIIALSLSLDPSINVHQASSGREALESLATAGWKPDCILLDARMPDMGGEDVLQAIRAIPRHLETPVIFLTANVWSSAATEYQRLGARGTIGKPFDPISLAEQVRALL